MNRDDELYWIELVELKVACAHTRRYRDQQASWVTRFAVIRAVASVSALGTWAVVRACDAVQNAIPFAARLRGANALLLKLDALFIDCLMDVERIRAGGIDDSEVIRMPRGLLNRRGEAEAPAMPGGLPVKAALLRTAPPEADAHFARRGRTGASP